MRGNAGVVFNIGQTAGNLFELLVADEFIAQKIAVRPGRNHKEGGSASPQEGMCAEDRKGGFMVCDPKIPLNCAPNRYPLLPQ